MKKLEEIDKNFIVQTKLDIDGLVFHNVKDEPFDLYGFHSATKGEFFKRLPEEVTKNANPGVQRLNYYPAGCRARFKTNSPYVAISSKYTQIDRVPQSPFSGTAGFDMYLLEDGEYVYEKTFIPPADLQPDGFESIHYFRNDGTKDITIYMPYSNDLVELYIGVADGSELMGGSKYKNQNPIVYYGSSITQGGCASRSGNIYENIVSRYFDYDFINLGFSGSAKGEKCLAEYIADMDMCCFVYDYDHNAETPEDLKATHKPMFDIIRKKNPELPIILMSAPPCTMWTKEDQQKRKEVVRETYNSAIKDGDKNIYFIEGDKMYDIFGGMSGTVDGCHPNDLGFMCMAHHVIEKMKDIF